MNDGKLQWTIINVEEHSYRLYLHMPESKQFDQVGIITIEMPSTYAAKFNDDQQSITFANSP